VHGPCNLVPWMFQPLKVARTHRQVKYFMGHQVQGHMAKGHIVMTPLSEPVFAGNYINFSLLGTEDISFVCFNPNS
jgi:hypothetical protein